MVRFKNRYFLVELIFEDGLTDESFNSQQLVRAIKDAMQLFHGDYGLGCVLSSLTGARLTCLRRSSL
jgi:RNase P/RNase MRP subunit POP5